VIVIPAPENSRSGASDIAGIDSKSNAIIAKLGYYYYY
jgi:hypothetical protein